MDKHMVDDLKQRHATTAHEAEGWRILLELILAANLEPKQEYQVSLALKADHRLCHTLFLGKPHSEASPTARTSLADPG